MDKFELGCRFEKVDRDRGLAFGWAVICEQGGKPFVDSQGHHIPESAMLDAAADFAKHAREVRDEHQAGAQGQALFLWPVTRDTASQFGMPTDKTGLLVGVEVSPGMLAKIDSGEYTGFSIGGVCLEHGGPLEG